MCGGPKKLLEALPGGRGQLDRGLGWAVLGDGARAYGYGGMPGRGMGGYKQLGWYKSLEGGKDLGVGGESLTWA